MPAPLYTCWPVMTEAVWLLRAQPAAVQRLPHGFGSGLLHLLPIDEGEVEAVAVLLQKYEDTRAQLADVALVYLARRERIDTIFTLDRRDFWIYRTVSNRPFHLLPK